MDYDGFFKSPLDALRAPRFINVSSPISSGGAARPSTGSHFSARSSGGFAASHCDLISTVTSVRWSAAHHARSGAWHCTAGSAGNHRPSTGASHRPAGELH